MKTGATFFRLLHADLAAHCKAQFWLDRADPDAEVPKGSRPVSRGTEYKSSVQWAVPGTLGYRVLMQILTPPPCPPVLARVWRVWHRVSHLRSHTDGGFGPLSLADVAVLLDRTETAFDPWEWDALVLIDGYHLASFHDRDPYPWGETPPEGSTVD